MKRLINVIMLVAEKYLYKFNVIISGNTLIMEYLYYIKGEQDVFKTFEVTEFEDKLAVKFIPERITRIMTLTELEDVFRILEKQANHKEHSEEEIKANSPSRSAKLRVIRKIKDATEFHSIGVIGY